VNRNGFAFLTLILLVGCGDDSHPAAFETPWLFFSQSTRPEAVMEALYEGTVSMDAEGCLRLDLEPDRHTVVWPFGSTAVTRAGRLVILDQENVEIGRVGGFFALGGGEVPPAAGPLLLSPESRALAEARCPGRFWIVGDIPR
jgi:hypothetical protein